MSFDLRNFYSGTSGLVLPVRNKLYYPAEFQDKSRLNFYASLTNSLEVNSSFYKVPLAGTVGKWAADVPDNFLFTFKLFREITHSKNLIFDREILVKFMQVIAQVGNKKGCLLVQFPPSIRINHLPQLKSLMDVLRTIDFEMKWKVAFEFRDSSLYVEEVYDLLNNYKFGMVIHDKGKSSSPMFNLSSDFAYLRLHGPNGNYGGTYSNAFLSEYATYIYDWINEDKQVFVYFNNTLGGAFDNLLFLKQALRNII